MKAPRLELADIVRQYGSAYLARYGKATFSQQLRVLRDMALCRTAALGGHVRQCDQCGHTDQRLLSLRDGKVSFRWKDYKNGNRQRTMTLDAVEFLRRFLLHVLPKGFVHIRYYGFLSNRNRRQKIALCRKLLGLPEKPTLWAPQTSGEEINESEDDQSAMLCPVCKKGHMVEVETIRRDPAEALKLLYFLLQDTR